VWSLILLIALRFIGGVLAFAFLMFYRSAPESPVWMESKKSVAP
jgi:hypothetical protein